MLYEVITIYVYMSNKNRVTNERITRTEESIDKRITETEQSIELRISDLDKKIDARIDDHAQRIARLEERSEHVPTHDDLAQIYERMKVLGTKLDTMNGEFGQVKNLIAVIHEYILKGGTK